LPVQQKSLQSKIRTDRATDELEGSATFAATTNPQHDQGADESLDKLQTEMKEACCSDKCFDRFLHSKIYAHIQSV